MKNIVVIGAGKGIGLEIVKLLSPNNNVWAITRTESAELSASRAAIQIMDITEANDTDFGFLPEKIDGVVYCPGSINLKPFNRLKSTDFQEDFKQNVLGAVSTLQHCLPGLKRSGHAGVVLFSTVASQIGMPFHASVAVSKSGIEGLTKSLAAEWAANHIRVNAIAPSLTDTPLASNLLNTETKRENAAKRHPLQRVGQAAEIAKMATFLLSDDAAWITGQVIGIDGGMGTLKL
jgi:3-oxoacyl-[acyl-carrier protein] reductase